MSKFVQGGYRRQEVMSFDSGSDAFTDKAYSTTVSSYPYGFRLTFAQGFLAGQLSIVVVALIVIRYVIFEDSRSSAKQKTRSARVRTTSQVDNLRRPRRSHVNKEGSNPDVSEVMADILEKLRYELESHSSESVDWLNVIFAQALAGYREDILAGGWSANTKGHDLQMTARDWMEEILNSKTIGRGMNFLDPIEVTHVTFGNSYPTFTNARVRPADDTGRLRVEVDIDYTDCIALSIETKLVFNFPRPRFAVLPVSLGLTIERFSGTLAIELFSTEASHVLPHSIMQKTPRSRHELHFSLHPDFALDASATSLVGSRAKLQDVPKIEQLLVDRVRNFVHDRFVWPKYWCLTLPNLVPRRNRKEDVDENVKEGMHLVGQGNALEDDETRQGIHQPFDREDDDNPQFASAVQQGRQRQQYPHHRHNNRQEEAPMLPGTLPNVEAWRSQGASSRLHHRFNTRQAMDSRVFSSHANDRYHNAVPSMASSVAYS